MGPRRAGAAGTLRSAAGASLNHSTQRRRRFPSGSVPIKVGEQTVGGIGVSGGPGGENDEACALPTASHGPFVAYHVRCAAGGSS
ncbi:MAG TPA: heme-binding protein [Stellaceae bacterium]|nr:heme-binding protein [Stellaceae bacterium]